MPVYMNPTRVLWAASEFRHKALLAPPALGDAQLILMDTF